MNILTDQYFTYRQSASSVDGVAKLELKGNSIGWNQLEANSNTTGTSNGITYTNNGDGSWTVTGTATATSEKVASVAHPTGIKGHKYLFKGCPSGGSTSTYMLRPVINGSAQPTSNRDFGNGIILECTTDSNPVYVRMTIPNGATISDVVFYPQVFDLTQTGLDNLTVQEFNALFPLDYYQYDSGSLLNFNGTGIRTVGKNLLSTTDYSQSQTINGLTFSVNDDKTITVNGTASATTNFNLTNTVDDSSLRPIFQDPVVLNGCPEGGQQGGALKYVLEVYCVDSSGTGINLRDAGSGVNIDLSDSIYSLQSVRVRIRIWSGTVCNNLVFKPMVRFADTDSTFEPYTSSTTSLPISAHFPTGMKSANNAYDEFGSKAITRIARVDLGTLDWTMGTSGNGTYFQTIGLANSIGKPSSNDVVANVLTSKYITASVNNGYSGSVKECVTCNVNGYVSIYTENYSDASTFKSAMSGQYLNYELSSYTEVDVSPIYYNTFKDGTEQLLPVNGASPVTSPLWADITYYTSFEGEIPYRKFWLINSNGDKWTFTEREFRVFLNNPQGLGFTKTISTNRYGNAQTITDISDNFPQISGDVLFYDSYNQTRYDRYNQFVKFISYEPLKLYYHLPVSYYSRIPNIYYIDCIVGSLNKTESKPDNLLTCPIQFNCLSFYKGEDVTVSGSGLSYTINNDSDFPIGFEITIEGSPVNPYVLLEQDGELYGEAKFDDSTAFDSVYVNSNDGEQNVILEQGGSILPNPLSYQDLSISNGSIYVTFVKLARGESDLTIGMDSGSVTSVNIKYVPLYRSV